LTGEIPPLQTNYDFTNTYSITGFCGIDQRSGPVFCSVHEEVNDTTEFSVSVELACAVGFFYHGDELILDNASIHNQGNHYVLEDWLWEHCGVLVLFLPPWSPELNPIKLVWSTTVKCLNTVPLVELYNIGAHSAAVEVLYILDETTHKEVELFFCGAGI
jgi:hypothetical protein